MASSTYQGKLNLDDRQQVRVATIRNPDLHQSHSHLFSLRVDKEVIIDQSEFSRLLCRFCGNNPADSRLAFTNRLHNKVTIIVEPPLKDIFRDVEKAPKYFWCKFRM